jgi:L-threonylcarbamoyladenylate synthase
MARQVLERNGLVGIPTETVYGLAGNAYSPDAVVKIFEVKNRPSFDPLIVHVFNLKRVEEITIHIPPKAGLLAKAFWPGPLTLLLEKRRIIPDIVTSGLSTVAVRIPDHPLTLELLDTLSFPLAAPSANPFGYVSPTTAKHVDDQLGAKISYILDGGDCPIGIESTIIGFREDQPEIYRLGGISVEEIESVVGKVTIQQHSTSRPATPGTLESHYAPGKKVFLADKLSTELTNSPSSPGWIRFREPYPGIPLKNQAILSAAGDLKEAAKNLFSALRMMDELDVPYVIVELVPEEGLGRAINDRLRRAAANAH